jgi:membrane protein implicated in regulation of membrane protease activity
MTTRAARGSQTRRPLRALSLVALAPANALAQGPVSEPGSEGTALPWLFVAFAVVALVVVFLVFRWLRRPPERPPFNRPRV